MMKRFTLFVFLLLACCLFGCNGMSKTLPTVLNHTEKFMFEFALSESEQVEEVTSEYLADAEVESVEEVESVVPLEETEEACTTENGEVKEETVISETESEPEATLETEMDPEPVEETVASQPETQTEQTNETEVPQPEEQPEPQPEIQSQPEQVVQPQPAPEENSWDRGYWFDEQLEAELLSIIQASYPNLQYHPYLHEGAREYAVAHEHNHSGVMAYYGASGNMQADFNSLNADYAESFAYPNWQYVGVAVYHENGGIVIFIVFS